MSERPVTRVRFAQLENRGILLGLSTGQVTALGVALVVAVIAEYTTGATGVLTTAPMWATLGLAALLPVRGRTGLAWSPVLTSWLTRSAVHATKARLSVADTTDRSLTVPGLPGHLRVLVAPAAGAAVVHDPRDATLTAVLALAGDGLILADAGESEQRLSGWERLLGSLCQQPSIVRAQVLARSVPGGAAPVRRWWSQTASATSPWAAQVVADLLAGAESEASRYETVLAVSLRAPRSSRHGLDTDTLATVEQQLAGIAENACSAGLRHDGWATPGRLAVLLRTSFDPYTVGGRDGVSSAPIVAGLILDEQWDRVRTDTAHHAVFWVKAWPRSDVHPTFLQPLLLGGGAHRTLSLTLEPVAIGRAMRDIRRARVEQVADTAQRERLGQLEDQTHRAQAQDVAQREAELVAGHGDLRFTGLLTVSAPTDVELEATCAATEAAAAQAMCELRRLVGQQGQAFLAGACPLSRTTS